MEAHKYHIMMFPWLAFGHLIPYFELSKRLAEKGIMVSYLSTPRNLQRLPPIPSLLQAKMKLLEVQMQPLHGLLENCEATIDVQPEKVQLLKEAHDTLAEPIGHLIEKLKPDLILLDFSACRIPEVAAKYGVSTAFFSVYTAATLTYAGAPAEFKDGKILQSPQDYVKLDNKPVHATAVSNGQRLAKIVEESSFVLVRSCEEFEGEYLNLLQEQYQKTVIPIGVLPPIPFLWVLRKPQGVDSSDLLPPGFLNRTQSLGLVVLGCTPQQEILAHPAIAGCLFHAGWGTSVEALSHGLPLVLLPMVADQGHTAKLLVEKQVGYEVPRYEDGSFSRDVVAESIRRVLEEEKGEQLRMKAAGMQSVFGNHESQDNYINKFIEHLKDMMIKKPE